MKLKDKKIQTFVISLTKEKVRRQTIKNKLKNICDEFIFFDGIDGAKEDLKNHPDYDGLRRRLCYGKDLSPGELGCYFSHRSLLKNIVQKEIQVSLIFEDDVVLSKEFKIVLESLLDCNYPWELIRFLGKPKITQLMQRKILKVHKDFYLTRLATSPGGAYAYLISYSGAKKLLRSMKRVTCPNDTIMGLPWRSGLDVLTIQPQIATWDKGYESSIGNERYEKNKLKGWEKIVYPFTRTIFKIHEGFLKKAFYFAYVFKDKRYKK